MNKPRKKTGESAPRSEHSEAALQEYEKGVRLMQQKDYQKAIPRFETVIEQYSSEAPLCDRARVYLRICRGENASRKPLRTTRNAAEAFEVGVFLLNDGDVREALRFLQRAVEHAPDDDAALSALASAQLQSGDEAACLRSLARAIELNPQNRVYAKNISDFDALAGKDEFEALVEGR